MLYEIDTLTARIVAGPAPVPAELRGLAPGSLADLSAALDPCPDAYRGRGFWPARVVPAALDPAMQRVSDRTIETPDPATRTVAVRALVVDLTPAEIEARAAAAAAALADAQAAAVAANNGSAGRAREAYLTAVPGQATTYAAKQAEVQRWIADGRPDDAGAASYPWAGDRADLRIVTVASVLAEWETVTAAWETVGRQIERERERVNGEIGAAATLDEIQAVRDSAAYPAP